MERRDYEVNAVAAVMKAAEKRVVLVSPTGSGKTVMAVMLLAKLNKSVRVLWIAHRVQLLRQAKAELLKSGVSERDVGILCGPEKDNVDARIVVASIDLLRRREVPAGIGLVIIDECHRAEAASYKAVLAAVPDARVIGLTATPWRLDGKGLGDTFEKMVIAAQPLELIVGGFIAKPIVYGIPLEEAKALVKGVRGGKEFNESQLARAMSRRTIMGEVVTETRKHALSLPTIVYAVNHKHGRALEAAFKKDKRKVAYVDAETSDSERTRIIAGLGDGTVQVVVNVDVLAEGLDAPSVKCIALCRPTKSLTRYLQYVGRAMRPYKGQRPIILDHAGNVWRHHLPYLDREWSLDGLEMRGGGMAPVKQCESCGSMLLIAASVCPECGAEQPESEEERLARDAELRRIGDDERTRVRIIRGVAELRARRGLSAEWESMAKKDLLQ